MGALALRRYISRLAQVTLNLGLGIINALLRFLHVSCQVQYSSYIAQNDDDVDFLSAASTSCGLCDDAAARPYTSSFALVPDRVNIPSLRNVGTFHFSSFTRPIQGGAHSPWNFLHQDARLKPECL